MLIHNKLTDCISFTHIKYTLNLFNIWMDTDFSFYSQQFGQWKELASRLVTMAPNKRFSANFYNLPIFSILKSFVVVLFLFFVTCPTSNKQTEEEKLIFIEKYA